MRSDPLLDLCAEVFDGRDASPGSGVLDALNRKPRDLGDACRAAAASGVWR
ncbi:hypothetical protein [Sorangium sp. So ce854]|uniref:hypothetical protein n=1 Tax=Sorangium sp. So ce854 TaxID=3133322 RepID=UPI003F6355C6